MAAGILLSLQETIPAEMRKAEKMTSESTTEPEVSNVVQVTLGEELFRFSQYSRWVNKAAGWFRRLEPGTQYVCIDSKGRICQTGKQFIRADNEGTFPIVVYSIG